MKKLLVLLMVLGLATTAQAGLQLILSSPTVGIGQDVTLSVSSDTAGAPGIWQGGLILSEDLVNWTTPAAAAYDETPPGAVTILPAAGDLGSAVYVPGYEGIVYRLNAAGTSILPASGVQFTIKIKGMALGDIGIGLQDLTYYSDMALPLTLTVSPEPITLALLGLGGLFLRRRK